MRFIMPIVVNIIGAGNLGKTIAHLLVKNHLVHIAGVCNTSEKSSIDAIKFIGSGEYCPSIADLPAADITIISTQDALISVICEELSRNKYIKQGSIVIHCSGSLTTDALIAAKKIGCYVASVHPMRSFAKPELSVQQYSGTYCAMEGDPEAIPIINDLFGSIGSITYQIDKDKKSLYHAAGVFASNYLVTLSQQALLCLEEAGVEREMAMKVITNLMQSSISNLETTLSPEQSLTGTIKRGDIETIKKHMESLENIGQKNLYVSLGKATIPIAVLDKDTTEKIGRVFNATNDLSEKKSCFFIRSRL